MSTTCFASKGGDHSTYHKNTKHAKNSTDANSSNSSASLVRPSPSPMGWSSLPTDLLCAIFTFLPADADRLRFRGVCAEWRAAAATWRPRPWLVGSRADGDPAMPTFWLSRRRGLLPFAAALPAGLDYLSSSRGYLALADPSTSPKALVLLNPATGRRVALPPIGFFMKWLDVAKVVLSVDPATDADWAAVAVGFPTTCLAYFTPAAAAWTRLDFHAAGYPGVEHYMGRFYVAFKFQVCVCQFGPAAVAVVPLEHADGGDAGPADQLRITETHLVECGGELLLVSVLDDGEYCSDGEAGCAAAVPGGEARRVEVHRVELVGERVRLVWQGCLGGRALFLCRNHAFALSPAEFPACRRDCVYLADYQGHPEGLVRVVDMKRPWVSSGARLRPAGRPELFAGWARRGWFLQQQ